MVRLVSVGVWGVVMVSWSRVRVIVVGGVGIARKVSGFLFGWM